MSNYPSTIDGPATLFSPVDAFSTKPLETTTTAVVLAGDTTISVQSTSGGFADTYGILSLDDELIVCTGKNTTQFTGCQRGAFGTTAAQHAQGATVKANMVSGFITAVQSAVLAIENELGTVAARNYVRANGDQTITGNKTLQDGASFGSGNKAATGLVRLPNAGAVKWRNAGNSGDLGMALNAVDHIAMDAIIEFAPGQTFGSFSYPDATTTSKGIVQIDAVGGIAVNAGAISLANSGVTPGTHTKVTVDTKGRVTAGTALGASDLPSHAHVAGDIASGAFGVPRGGTGLTTVAANKLLYSPSQDTLAELGIGSGLSLASGVLSLGSHTHAESDVTGLVTDLAARPAGAANLTTANRAVLVSAAGVVTETSAITVAGGNPTFTGQGLFAAGSQGAPSISFGGDSDTGMYSDTADRIGFSAGGAKRFHVSSSEVRYLVNGVFNDVSVILQGANGGFRIDDRGGGSTAKWAVYTHSSGYLNFHEIQQSPNVIALSMSRQDAQFTVPVRIGAPSAYLECGPYQTVGGAFENMAKYSEDFSVGSWDKNGGSCSVTANSTAAPDGNTTADTVTASTATPIIQQQIPGLVDGGTYTFYVWAKVASGTRKVSLSIVNNAYGAYLAGPTQVTLTTAWQRFKITGTLAGGQTGLWIVVRQYDSNGDDWISGDIHLWGACLQQGSDPKKGYARTWAFQTANVAAGIACGAVVISAKDNAESPLRVYGPGSNLADHRLIEVTAGGELILAGGAGNGYRLAELMGATNPSGWSGVLKVKTPAGATAGYILLYSNP